MLQSLEWVLSNVDGHLFEAEARELYSLAHGTVVEIGSYRGRSTCVMGLGVSICGGCVYAIDPHLNYRDHDAVFGPEDNGELLRNLVAAGVADVVRVIHLSSDQAAARWKENINLLFIDGNHDVQTCRLDFLYWSPFVVRGGYIAFHDSDYPSVAAVIDEALSRGWVFVERVDSTTVLRRKDAKSK